MLKLLLGIIATLLLLLVLTLTNPGLQMHQLVLERQASLALNAYQPVIIDTTQVDSLPQRLSKPTNLQRREAIIDEWISRSVMRTNYLLFSTAQLTHNGQVRTVSYGVLGNVYPTDDLANVVAKAAVELRQ